MWRLTVFYLILAVIIQVAVMKKGRLGGDDLIVMPWIGLTYLPDVTLQSDGLHSPGLQDASFVPEAAVFVSQGHLQLLSHLPLFTQPSAQRWSLHVQSFSPPLLQQLVILALPSPTQHLSPAWALYPVTSTAIKAIIAIIKNGYLFIVFSIL